MHRRVIEENGTCGVQKNYVRLVYTILQAQYCEEALFGTTVGESLLQAYHYSGWKFNKENG